MYRHRILQPRAKDLRQNFTQHESALWKVLRNRQVGGWKFRRQYVIEPYIVDFFCHELKLVIEIDGGSHDERVSEDKLRDDYLRQCGYEIIRFWNEDVKYDEALVMEQIVRVCRLQNQKATDMG